MNASVHVACRPEWRFGRSFSATEIERRLSNLSTCPLSAPQSEDHAISDPTWGHYYSEAIVAVEEPGEPVPGGAFERARQLIAAYEFSDPRIVTGYFDPRAPLLGRPMLLEIRVLGMHYVCGVLVRGLRDEASKIQSVFGFRYDTLEGHLEAGAEWFLLTKHHASGQVWFRIQATFREGQFPNWWSRAGFRVLCRPYQRAWHRLAYLRLREMLEARELPALPRFGKLMREGRPVSGPPLISVAGEAPPEDMVIEQQT